MKRRPKFETYEDAAGAWRWRLKAGNGEIVATGESHTRERDAKRAARRATELAAIAIAEVPPPRTPVRLRPRA